MQLLWIRCKMQAYFHLKKKYMEQNLCLQAMLLSVVNPDIPDFNATASMVDSQRTDVSASCICKEGEIHP